MKNSPSFFSALDFAPFFEVDEYDDEEDEAAVEVEGVLTSASSHRYEST